MKKYILIIILNLLPIMLYAFVGEATVNGVKYYIVTKTKTAEVMPSNYSGHIVIPSTIEYDGVICNVTCIREDAFNWRENLYSVVIGNNVTTIGKQAFFNCNKMTSVVIGNKVETIDDQAFSFCESLSSINIPSSVTTIGDNAFQQCKSLVSISIPNSVTSIGNVTFGGCSKLNSITLPNNMTKIGHSMFASCSSLSSITIPNSVTSIADRAFEECTNLKSITIPNAVSSIGESAFYNCSKLSSITIGSGISIINNYAFYNCSDLTDVYCYATSVPTAPGDIFENSLIEYAALHVPQESLEAYKIILPWSGFGEIVGINEEEKEKCAIPTISYVDGTLKFDCDTENAECISTIKDSDITSYSQNEVHLTATYHISVYAKKVGYADSDIATATLCWIDADPIAEGTKEVEDNVTELKAFPVLIQAKDDTISIRGAKDGSEISVYNSNGINIGSTLSNNGKAKIVVPRQFGTTAIVKIGEKAIKVLLR